jgi:hypothetical protein
MFVCHMPNRPCFIPYTLHITHYTYTICTYAHMHICTYAHMHICTYTPPSFPTHIHIHTYTHTSIHTYTHIHIYIYTYKHTHIYTYTHTQRLHTLESDLKGLGEERRIGSREIDTIDHDIAAKKAQITTLRRQHLNYFYFFWSIFLCFFWQRQVQKRLFWSDH